MNELCELLALTSSLTGDFLDSLDRRPVFSDVGVEELRRALGGPLPAGPTTSREVIAELARAAEPGLTAMPSGRWFGFVIGAACRPLSPRTGLPRPGTRMRGSSRPPRRPA